jgi:hypothetical protein
MAERPDFSSWSRIGTANWHIAGNSAATGPEDGAGYLVSPQQYGDVKISVEVWIEDSTNSGVFVRCIDPEAINPDNCYEINIWDNHPNQDFRTGSIVKLVTPEAHVNTVGRWSTIKIEAVGESVTATVNGVLTARSANGRSSSGYIALQYAGSGELRFRNLVIEPFAIL